MSQRIMFRQKLTKREKSIPKNPLKITKQIASSYGWDREKYFSLSKVAGGAGKRDRAYSFFRVIYGYECF